MDWLLLIKAVWWQLFGAPLQFGLEHLAAFFNAHALTHAIGPLGLAIIAVTFVIKTVLFPAFYAQVASARRAQQEQRRIAPELAELRRKFRSDLRALQTEMMKLYQRHQINPLGGLAGCIPALLQAPILYALYFAIAGFQTAAPHHFLWVHDLTHAHEPVLAVLAALLTYVSTLLASTPPAFGQGPDQSQQAAHTLSLIMPLIVGLLAWNFTAGLALYWITSTGYQIGQQALITGWGTLSLRADSGATAHGPSVPGLEQLLRRWRPPGRRDRHRDGPRPR